MDDIDDDAIARYPSNQYGVGYPNNQGYGYLKHPLRNSSYSHPAANESTRDYDHVDDEDRLGGNDDEDRLGGDDDEDQLGGNDDDDDVVDEDRLGGDDDVVVHDDDDDDQHSLKQADDDDSDGGGDENDDNDRLSEEYGYLKDSVRNSPYSQPFVNEGNNDEDEEDEERLVEEDDDVDIDQNNNGQLSLKHADEEDSNDEDGDRDENIDNNDGGNDNKQVSYAMMNEDELEWRPKKQKLKSLMSTYEFAARVPTPSAAAASAAKRSFGVRNSLTEWTEKETFVLLDAWGDRFLQHRRKSLRSEEWQQVAEKVSVVSKVERTGTQCRNRLDTLKKKYKKDKIKFQDMGGGDRKWVYFQKMDKLMSSPPQQARLSCRSNSRERIFMKPGVYVNHANEMDDMKKDSPPENTESVRVEGFEGPRPKKRRKGRGSDEASSFKLLADSIQNFGKIYEKIENSKRQQMMELEKMRMDFLNDLEAQKRQIFERLQSEILKIEQRDD